MALTSNQKMFIAGFAVIAILCIGTLTLVNGEFGGSDDAGGGVAEDYGYEPWCADIFETFGFELPGETESLLFAVQAAIGAIIIGYFIGVSVTKKKLAEKKE